jgi:para-aminobenzoate synthetase
MKILLINNGTTYLKELEKWIGSEYDLVDFDQKPDLTGYDLVVLSGGHTYPVMNHDKEFGTEIELIKSSNKPIIGICLGFELIAHVFGCKLVHLGDSQHGSKIIEKTFDHDLFPEKFEAYESHQWAVRDLSGELKELARSEFGVEAFKHKNLPIIGFQFHPEILGFPMFEKVVETIK